MPRLSSFVVALTAVLQARVSLADNNCPNLINNSNNGVITAGCCIGEYINPALSSDLSSMSAQMSSDMAPLTSSCFPFCDRAVTVTTVEARAKTTPSASCSGTWITNSDPDYSSKVSAAVAGQSVSTGDASRGTTLSTSATASSTSGSASSSSSSTSGTAAETITKAATSTAGTDSSSASSSAASSSSSAAAANGNAAGLGWGVWAAGVAAAGPGLAAVLL